MKASPLPTGTVTYLFTDIEGSTRLWEEHPEQMQPALAHHDALIRQAVEDEGGCIFKSSGDGLYAAFPSAPTAVAAAFAAQRALLREQWPEQVPLRVRIALHTGTAELRAGDYYGPPLNRLARLLSVGHGGQILLSHTTQELSYDALPPFAALRDMGEHRLRDLTRPEQVFQLLHDDLPADFPPLRSLDNPALHHNLPQQVSSFIGRVRERAELREMLGKTRLLTITGAGGAGKTRLSLQLAAEELEKYPDGVWLVEFAPLTMADQVLRSVATLLGVREDAGKALLETLIDHLRNKHLLLILDNCEHLLNASAHLASGLLRSCPQVTILATSREALAVAGEVNWRLPCLACPDPKRSLSWEHLPEYDGIRLFVERAVTVQTAFALTGTNAPFVTQICDRLDGIPLAIELAAARVRALPVDQIARRLDDRFRLLTSGSRTALPRQQTLRAALDWSYDLLSHGERIMFHRLSVFAGGASLEAIEQVCADDTISEWEILDLLTALVDKNLVVYDEQSERQGGARYRLLETMRHYARQCLLESNGGQNAQNRHRQYYQSLAEDASVHWEGPEQATWYNRLEREHDNLRTALHWCHETEGEESADAAVQIAGALWTFWMGRNHIPEGFQWLKQSLDRPEAQRPLHYRARALNGAGMLALMRQDQTAAQPFLEESVAIWQSLGRPEVAYALNSLGFLYQLRNEPERAKELYIEAVAVAQKANNRRLMLYPLQGLASIARQQNLLAEAAAHLEECGRIGREFGDNHALIGSLLGLAEVQKTLGNFAAVQTCCIEAVTAAEQLKDAGFFISALHHLAEVALLHGDYDTAHHFYERRLRAAVETGIKQDIGWAYHNLAVMAQYQDDYPRAQQWFQESESLLKEAGSAFEVAYLTIDLAWFAWWQKDFATAHRLFGDAERYFQENGTQELPHETKCCLGWLMGDSGECVRACALFRESVAGMPPHFWGRRWAPWCLMGLARTQMTQGQTEKAVQVMSAGDALSEVIGLAVPARLRREREAVVVQAKAVLGDEVFALYWNRGRVMAWEDAFLTQESSS